MKSYLVEVYVIYALVGIGLTVWLARVLSKNGAIFLRDVFADNPDLAKAVNHLLVVGFYLFNLGYAALILKAQPSVGIISAIEVLAWKLGLLLLSLALMHFMNLFIFQRIRRRAQQPPNALPVPPQGYYPAMAGHQGGYAYAGQSHGQGQPSNQASAHSAFELIDRHEERQDKSPSSHESDDDGARRRNKKARPSANEVA